MRVCWSNVAAYDKSRAFRDDLVVMWDLCFVQNDISSIWGVKAEDCGRFVTLNSLVSDCVSTDFRCFKEFTFIQKPLTIYRNCQREEWTQKLVPLSQKQGQAVGDNMKLCYWTMTAFSCPLFRCPPIPVPQFRCRGPWTVKGQETAVRSQQEHTPFIIHLVVGLKFWVLGLLDETDIQSTQRMSLNQQSACAFAFCFRRSEWLNEHSRRCCWLGKLVGHPLRLWDGSL